MTDVTEVDIPEAADIECSLDCADSDPHTTQTVLRARLAVDSAAPEVAQAIRTSAKTVLEYVNVLDAPWPSPTALGAGHGLAGQLADALAAVCCIPAMVEFHAARGVPREQTWAVLADLPRQIRLHRRVHGCDGFAELHRLANHLRGLLYDMGRLQFERRRTIILPDDQAALAAAGADLSEGAVLLSTHIPDTGPMDPAACDASFARILAELPRWFPDERYTGFFCLSWLNDPQLAEYLPADSNIVKFQRRFELVGPGFPAGNSAVPLIFRVPADTDLDRLPQRTTLERAFVRHLRDGGEWLVRTGWFPAEAARSR